MERDSSSDFPLHNVAQPIEDVALHVEAQQYEAFYERTRNICAKIGNLLSCYDALDARQCGWIIYDNTPQSGCIEMVGGRELLITHGRLESQAGVEYSTVFLCTNEPIELTERKQIYLTRTAMISASGYARYLVDSAHISVTPETGRGELELTTSPLFRVNNGRVEITGPTVIPQLSASRGGDPSVLPFGTDTSVTDKLYAVAMAEELLESIQGEYPRHMQA